MMTDVAGSPLRVGLLGLGRSGLHLLECFATGGPLRVVAAFANPSVAELLSPFGVRLVADPQELCAATDVDVLWIAEHDALRSDLSLPELLSAKHVILETPIGVTPAVLDQAFNVALERGRQLLVRHPRRTDPEFLHALSVTQDQSIGQIRSAKLTSWTYAIPPQGAVRGTGPLQPDGLDDTQITKTRFVAHAMDQLVSLIDDRPVRVFAIGEPDASGHFNLLARFSLSMHILFERGCQAEIDIRLDSPTQFQSGWMLTAQRGGYAKGRRFTLTDEGEIFDAPVSLGDDDKPTDEFVGLAQQIRSAERNTTEEARLRTVVALLDGAQRSLESRQAVDL